MDALTIGNGGWVRYQSSRLGDVVVYLRVELADDGRLEIVDLYIDGGPITTATLRNLPIGRLAEWANVERDRIAPRLELPGPDLSTAAAVFRANLSGAAGHRIGDWSEAMLWSQFAAWQIDEAELGPLADDFLTAEAKLAAKRPAVPPPDPNVIDEASLVIADRPAKRPYPPEFWEAVAAAYEEAARVSQKPAAELARANEVPTTTAHRWVRECRIRGLLPPSRRMS